jgi:hypothetical protein
MFSLYSQERPEALSHRSLYKLEGRKYKLKWDRANLCFRASGYGVRGIEKQESKERPGKCVYKGYVWRIREGEAGENTKMSTGYTGKRDKETNN